MMGSREQVISVDEARRIALAAQGFSEPRPARRADARRLRRMIERVAVLQLDSVNVVCRSHYLPLFARLGPYSRATLDRLVWNPGSPATFEYWAHKASILPIGLHPLLRWKMQAIAQQDWAAPLDPAINIPWAVVAGMRRLATERPGYVDQVRQVIRRNGPVTASQADPDGQRRKRDDPDPDPSTGKMWNWQDAKIAAEFLFYSGEVSVATRRNFERVYDLAANVIPPGVLSAAVPDRADAQRELVRIAARASGIATAQELYRAPGGYTHLPPNEGKARVTELVDSGELIPVRVEGRREHQFLYRETPIPSKIQARALLSPFDSLIWNRDRTQRLFDFHYRISIYTPAARRAEGYYVMPFLLGHRLVARVDLKADREASVLRVPVVNREPCAPDEQVVAAELAEQLQLMAGWLELERVSVSGQGNLGPALKTALPG